MARQEADVHLQGIGIPSMVFSECTLAAPATALGDFLSSNVMIKPYVPVAPRTDSGFRLALEP